MALSRCGTFGYSLTGSANQNGINNDSGLSDCSGWVIGTLRKARIDCPAGNAATFASMGVYNGAKVPGCVITHNRGGTGKNGTPYSGHVAIYARYLENGPNGAGHYIMDCSSKAGGSSLRKISEKALHDQYPYSWNSW